MSNLSLSQLGRVALDLLYPPRCVLCERHGDFLCEACSRALPRAGGLRCEVCWLPLSYGSGCWHCAEHRLSLTRLRSVFRYEGDVRRLVHTFKFRGHSSLAPTLGRLLAHCYLEEGLEADLIVPVPLTGRRQRERGFNQALLLARELSRALDLPVSEALRRRRMVAPQAGSATAEARRRNVAGVFEASQSARVQGLRLLLIDDVATTGATLSACADALLEAGAASVSGLTLARED
jgi:competence protein ComFC